MGEVVEDARGRSLEGTILFATVGRSKYAFDVFAVSLPDKLEEGAVLEKLKEEKLTDGKSVNFNGHLVDGKGKEDVLDWLKKSGSAESSRVLNDISADEIELLTYVSERDGSLVIYINALQGHQHPNAIEGLFKKLGGVSRESGQSGGKILLARPLFEPGPHLQDRPQFGGGRIVYVSTEEGRETKRESWTAVYSTSLIDPKVIRLTPKGVSDYSPSISPSGKWVIAASSQSKGWQGEVEELETDLYVFDAADGSQRRLVTKHGGWPSWLDDSTFYFHRQADDGWWSVFRVTLPEDYFAKGGEPLECRVTPPGVHAFTPSASRTGDWIAVATRRPNSKFRHVEIFDLRSRTFIKLTENISPNTHHYNPFVSSSSNKIVYHRCRGCVEQSIIPRLEPIKSAVPSLSLVRVDGIFPSFSHDGSLIAYIPDLGAGGVYVTKPNGEGIRKIFSGLAFGTAWDWKRNGVVYTSSGKSFAGERIEVHVVSIFNADREEPYAGKEEYKQLTRDGTGNNGFPSPSPDGKYVVFRSGRSGHKNLYIMDAVKGEESEIRQLTDGPWTDTMPAWSPTGEWIAFSSDRENPAQGSFAGYLIRPDGTGLHMVLSDGGRVNHLYFSPDGRSLVFTADFAALSAEPISSPNQFQPYGEIFISKIDGSCVQRLTHNAYEDGTPNWGHTFLKYSDLSAEGEPVSCDFDEPHWLAKGGDDLGETASEAPPTWCPRMHRSN